MGANYKVGLFPVFGWLILIFSGLYWFFYIESNGLVALVIGRVFGLMVMVPIAMFIFLKYFKVNYLVFLRQMSMLALLMFVPLILKILAERYILSDSIIGFIILSLILYFSHSFLIYLVVLDKLEKTYVRKIITKMVTLVSVKIKT